MFIGPFFAYNFVSQFRNTIEIMQVDQSVYFGYAIPAVLLFILGLHITSKKLEGEILNTSEVSDFISDKPYLPYTFLAIGFAASFIGDFFDSDFAFVFYLFGVFKFLAVFLLFIGNSKYKIYLAVLVYGYVLWGSLQTAMFHDFFIWTIFFGAVIAIVYKPDIRTKSIITFSFFILSVFIQIGKGNYRTAIRQGNEATGLETFSKAYEANQQASDSWIDINSLAKNNSRINQGYILSNILITVPDKIQFENGKELILILESAIFPRFLVPNKLNAGDQKIFTKYSGLKLNKKTSMALGSLGDGYINFGTTGGCIFMFFLGLLYSEVLKGFKYYSKTFPILLLFVPLVFYYPIRPDCELQTILGHLVKSCFLIFVVFLVWKKYFKAPVINLEKDPHPDSLVPSRL